MMTLFHGSYVAVKDYENGIITATQALGQLRYKEVNHQICILNQEIADKYLTYVASETLKQEDRP